MKSSILLIALVLAPGAYQAPLMAAPAASVSLGVPPQRPWQVLPGRYIGGHMPANVCFVPAQNYVLADIDRNGRLSWGEIVEYCRAIRDEELRVGH